MLTKGLHDQQIYFDNGTVRELFRVRRKGQGNWYHYITEEGYEYIVNPNRVLFVRIIPEEVSV